MHSKRAQAWSLLQLCQAEFALPTLPSLADFEAALTAPAAVCAAARGSATGAAVDAFEATAIALVRVLTHEVYHVAMSATYGKDGTAGEQARRDMEQAPIVDGDTWPVAAAGFLAGAPSPPRPPHLPFRPVSAACSPHSSPRAAPCLPVSWTAAIAVPACRLGSDQLRLAHGRA